MQNLQKKSHDDALSQHMFPPFPRVRDPAM